MSVVRLLGYNFKVGIVNTLGFQNKINWSLALDCFSLIIFLVNKFSVDSYQIILFVLLIPYFLISFITGISTRTFHSGTVQKQPPIQ